MIHTYAGSTKGVRRDIFQEWYGDNIISPSTYIDVNKCMCPHYGCIIGSDK